MIKNIKNGRERITKILLFGANGQLGKELSKCLKSRFSLDSYSKTECDVTNHNKVKKILNGNYDVVINASGFTKVDRAEVKKDYSNKVNNLALKNIVDVLENKKTLLIHYSTDYVFDGNKKSPYLESDMPNPLNNYGKSKLDGEKYILNSKISHFIFRTSWVYDNDSDNFPNKIISKFDEKQHLKIIDDQVGAPTHVQLVTTNTLVSINFFLESNNATRKEISGLYHLTSSGKASWYDFAYYLLVGYASKKKLNMVKITKLKTSQFMTLAKRPLYSVLDCGKFEKTFSTELESWKVHADCFIRSKS